MHVSCDRAQPGRASMSRPRSRFAALWLGVAFAMGPTLALGQTFTLTGANLQERVNGVLGLMGFMLTPDVTTGSLSIASAPTGNPQISLTSLGGGFTLSKAFPLYLEGTAGYSRYDPVFLASDGQSQRPIPVKWNAISATGGIGWDFPLARELVLRPMFNFSYGHVESDASLAGRFLLQHTGTEIDFLEKGRLNSYGLGGSLMLDYEGVRPDHEIDAELRYTNIDLRSYGDSSPAVQGRADAQSINLWTRWRAPTGMMMLERPVRYVLEYAHTTFLGDLDNVLGFNHLNSVGAGLELDSSKYDMIVTRTRLVARYKFGEGVRGWTIGLAMSF